MILFKSDAGLMVLGSNYLHFPNGARVHRTASLEGNVYLGQGVVVRPGAVIGTPAEKEGFWDKTDGAVYIGDRTIISDLATVHAGANIPTIIKEDCRIMAHAHIGHDSWVGPGAVVSCSAMVGGHSVVGKGANLGLGAVLHQYSIIGDYAMVGANSFVPKKRRIVPGNIYVGSPVRFLKNNTIGLQRAGVAQEELQQSVERYYELTKDWANVE